MRTTDVSIYINKIQQLLNIYSPARRQPESKLPADEVQVITNFIIENAGIFHENLDELPDNRSAKRMNAGFDKTTFRFMSILNRLSRAHEGVSRQERLFLCGYLAGLEKRFQKSSN